MAKGNDVVISIVLPTYNGARYLKTSVDSCLAQTFQSLELIVVVDGSTDNTRHILESYHDPRLMVKHTENQGLPSALNHGFTFARGKYWSWTSDDNEYLPDAFEVMLKHLDAHPDTPMVYTAYEKIDEKGNTIGKSRNEWACFLYRAEAARKAGIYRPEYRLVEDVDFFLRLRYSAGPFIKIPEVHYRYRLHGKSLSKTKIQERQFASLRMHYNLITRGIENEDLRELFRSRMSTSAIYRDYVHISKIVDFGFQNNVTFLPELKKFEKFLRTPWGWLGNRLKIALQSRIRSLKSALLIV